MKKCIECELNYVKDDETLCMVCKEKKYGIKTNKVSSKLQNYELGGKYFSNDITGFSEYLMARGYGIASDAGNLTTTVAYVMAVVKILEIEKLSYENLLKKIDKIVQMYDMDGPKKELGNYQHGTYRNAIKRFQEFIDYQKFYMSK